jgi:hypothetical protein
MQTAAVFDESKHPRDHGKFSSKEGGSAKSSDEKIKKIVDKLKSETPEDVQDDVFNAHDNSRYFMVDDGSFVKGGTYQHGEAMRRFGEDLGLKESDSDFTDSHNFMKSTGMIRVTPMSDKKLGVDLAGKPTISQLRKIFRYQKEGYEVQFDLFKDGEHGYGTGMSDLRNK